MSFYAIQKRDCWIKIVNLVRQKIGDWLCTHAYLITNNHEDLQEEFINSDVKIVRSLSNIEYNNKKYVNEDIDARWIVFGIKRG